jgi:AcrR family transcriptional regulator
LFFRGITTESAIAVQENLDIGHMARHSCRGKQADQPLSCFANDMRFAQGKEQGAIARRRKTRPAMSSRCNCENGLRRNSKSCASPFMKTTPRKARKYHHGNLRASLMRAARELLREEGEGGLSLRLVAKSAKVSHNAPYHHFPDKSALLAALAAEGFNELALAIEREQSSRASEGAVGKIIGIGAGYFDFAVRNPSLFQMMFRTEATQPHAHPELRLAERRAFGALVAAIDELDQARLLPKGKSKLAASAFAWSTVHGLATLHIQNVLAETPLGEVPLPQIAEQTLKLIVLAILAPEPTSAH